MTAFERARLIASERDGLREENVMLQRSVHRAIFIFLAAFIGIMGVYYGKDIGKEFKPYLILALSQAEVLLYFFVVALSANQSVHGAYIAALEKKLNELAEGNINIWESRIAPEHLYKPTCPCGVACVVQHFAYLVLFIFFIYLSFKTADKMIWGVVFAIEVGLCFALQVWLVCKHNAVAQFAEKELGKN